MQYGSTDTNNLSIKLLRGDMPMSSDEIPRGGLLDKATISIDERTSQDARAPSTVSQYLARRLIEKQDTVLILLMDRSGQGTYHNLTIPQLFDFIQHKVKSIDTAWEMMAPLLSGAKKTDATTEDPAASSHTDASAGAHGSRRSWSRGGAGAGGHGHASSSGGGSNSSSKVTRTARYRDVDRLKRMIFPYDVPTVLVRRHCVLLLLDPLRAVVFSDQMLVVVPDGADSIIAVLNTYMSGLASALDVEDFDVATVAPHSESDSAAEHRPGLHRTTEHITPRTSTTSRHSHPSSGVAVEEDHPEQDGEDADGASSDSVDGNEEEDENNYAKYATAFSVDASDAFGEDRERTSKMVHHRSMSEGLPTNPQITVATEIPFEYQAFEAIFETVITIFNQEFVNVAAKLRLTLHKIKDASLLSLRTQEKMAALKNRVGLLLAKVIAHRTMLEEAMNDEELMALMNLSRLKSDPGLYTTPLSEKILNTYEHTEAFFDTYQVELSSLQTKLTLLKQEYQNAEDLTGLRLSTSQNKLLYADSIIMLVTAFVALGSTVGGIFGMNVMNSLEQDDHAFKIIVGTTVACIAVGISSVYAYFRMTGTFPKIFDKEYLSND